MAVRNAFSASITDHAVKTIKQAVKSENKEQWIQAIELEHDALNNLGAWEVVRRQDHMAVIGSMVLLKEKRTHGKTDRLKARIMARGDQL